VTAEEVVRRLFERWRNERALDLFHADCEWDMSGTSIAEGVYHGHEGVNRFLDNWMSLWDGFRSELERLEPAPDGRVAVSFIQSGRAHGSAARMDQHFGALFTVEDGLIRRVEHFDHPEDAWRAAEIE
jgi:ketosteroid isomerase-like protein